MYYPQVKSRISTSCLAPPLVALVALVALSPAVASADEDMLEFLEEVHGHVENLKDAYSNYQQCVARGADPALCEALAAYCAIPGSGLIDSRAGLFSKLDLFQSFKVDCGDGECYQCCFTGDGCHTSFVGFPVINCNLMYGPETRDAGITLIVDPDAQPGDSCLAIPQTCEHLSLCLGDPNALAELREELENGLEHPLNMAGAAEQRLRYFGKDFYDDWLSYLNRFHTGVPVEPDPEFTSFGALAELDHFLSGRGCVGWRQRLAAIQPYDWSGEHFAVYGEGDALSEPASRLNGVRMIGLMRLLDAIPNVAARHAAVESTVWPDVDRAAYLGQLDGEPDDAILEVASPIFLDLLKRNAKISDYRLLAVPLAEEAGAPARFNGCELGVGPRVFALAEEGRADGVLSLQIEDPEVGSEHEDELRAVVFWGDGTASHETVAAGSTSASFTHDYAAPGRYVARVVVENSSGLRGVTSAVVESAAAAAEPSAPYVFSEARVVDAVAYVDVLSGNERKLYFEMFAHDADTDEELLVGVSQERGIPFNVDAPLGTLVGHNPDQRVIDRLTLRPAWRDGFYGLGWGGHFMTVAGVELQVPSTVTGEPTGVPVPLTTENVRVYPVGGDAPVDVEYLSETEDGRALIWLHSSFEAERIEIDIPADLLAAHAPGPTEAGEDELPGMGSYLEVRPGVFERVDLMPEEPGGTSDGGSDGGSAGGDDDDDDDSAGGTASDGGSDGGTAGSSGEGGCGCAASGRGETSWAWIFALGLAARRRRTRS